MRPRFPRRRRTSEVLAEALPGHLSSGLLRTLATLARPYWRALLPVAALLLVGAAAEALTVALYMPLFQVLGGSTSLPALPVGPLFEASARVLRNRSLAEQVWLLALAFGAAAILRSATGYASSLAVVRFTTEVDRSLRQRMFGLYLGAEYQFFLDRRQGRLLDDLLEQPRRAAQAISLFLNWGQMLVNAAGIFVVLLAMSWQATLAALVLGAGLSASLWRLRLRAFLLGRTQIINQREIKSLAAEVLNGIRQVKLFGAEQRLLSKYGALTGEHVRLQRNSVALSLLPSALSGAAGGLVLPIAMAALLFVAPVDLATMLPLLGAFWLTSSRMLPLVASLSTERIRFYSQAPTVRFVVEVLHTTPSERSQRETAGRGRPIERLDRGITFERVSFRYTRSRDSDVIPERPTWADNLEEARRLRTTETPKRDPVVLRDVSLEFQAGRVTALVGPSGAGKSTIVDLIARLFTPQEGRIAVDGIDIREYDLASWRQHIGYVSQDTFIFNGTISENIAFSKPGASLAEIERAARIANAEEFIARLPAGYDTVVGDRGMKLSGGQRQRIAIARAVLRDPPILVFDEATSSLDTVAERAVQAGIEAASRDRTVIVVAHRLSTIMNADRIYVIEAGRVVEAGRHDELMGAGGVYRTLYAETTVPSDGLTEEILAEGRRPS